MSGIPFANNTLSHDPPDHTRLRKAVQPAFSPRRVARLRERIQRTCDELVDGFASKGNAELIADFAFPLPVIVPQTDLVTDLVTAEDPLSDSEITSTITLLLVAGFLTTVNLIGNAAFAMLQHPEQLSRLRADPSLIPVAVEEFLRFNAPFRPMTIFAKRDVEIGGQVVPAGDSVTVLLDAVNHDPGRFEEPENLLLDRKLNSHLAFGHGIHRCVGAPLAGWKARSPCVRCSPGFLGFRSATRKTRSCGGLTSSSTGSVTCQSSGRSRRLAEWVGREGGDPVGEGLTSRKTENFAGFCRIGGDVAYVAGSCAAGDDRCGTVHRGGQFRREFADGVWRTGADVQR